MNPTSFSSPISYHPRVGSLSWNKVIFWGILHSGWGPMQNYNVRPCKWLQFQVVTTQGLSWDAGGRWSAHKAGTGQVVLCWFHILVSNACFFPWSTIPFISPLSNKILRWKSKGSVLLSLVAAYEYGCFNHVLPNTLFLWLMCGCLLFLTRLFTP